jgi:O-antigen ligase
MIKETIDSKDYFIAISTGIFLFILPFTHTVAIRLSFLLISLILVLSFYKITVLREVFCKLPLLIWVIFPILMLPFAIDLSYSLSEIKVEIAYSVLAFILFFIISYHKVWFVKTAILAMTISLLLVSIWGLINSYMHQGIWEETARHNGSASYISYTLILIPLLVMAYFLFIKYRILIITIALFFIITSFLSGQRIFLVAILLELLVFIFWARKYFVIDKRKLLWVAGTFIIIASLLAFVSLLNRFHGSLDTAIDYQQHDPRIELLSIPFNIIQSAPLIGYGFGRDTMLHIMGGQAAMDKVMIQQGAGYQYDHAHNIFLNYTIELGLFGLITLVTLLACLIRKYYQLSQHSNQLIAVAGSVGLAIILGFILRNQTNDMFYRDISLFFWSVQGILFGFIAQQLVK